MGNHDNWKQDWRQDDGVDDDPTVVMPTPFPMQEEHAEQAPQGHGQSPSAFAGYSYPHTARAEGDDTLRDRAGSWAVRPGSQGWEDAPVYEAPQSLAAQRAPVFVKGPVDEHAPTALARAYVPEQDAQYAVPAPQQQPVQMTPAYPVPAPVYASSQVAVGQDWQPAVAAAAVPAVAEDWQQAVRPSWYEDSRPQEADVWEPADDSGIRPKTQKKNPRVHTMTSSQAWAAAAPVDASVPLTVDHGVIAYAATEHAIETPMQGVRIPPPASTTPVLGSHQPGPQFATPPAAAASEISIGRGIVGGVVGAILGAALWGGIGFLTGGWELKYAAIVIGVLTGGGVRMLGGGSSKTLGFLGAATGLLGILGGKALFEVLIHPGWSMGDHIAYHTTGIDMVFYVATLATGFAIASGGAIRERLHRLPFLTNVPFLGRLLRM